MADYRKAIFVFVMIVAAIQVEAATLKGIVLSNEIGGSTLPNVEVTAIVGANPTVSDSVGRFSLDFPQKRPGDWVRIIVNRPGYVVVNDIQMELALPADSDSRPVSILLCKEGDREEMARRFYRLKTQEAIEATYKRRLKELEDRHKADAEAIAKLRQERDQALAAAEYAREIPGQTFELNRQAMRLFLDGKIDEALRVLDEVKLQRSLKAARKSKAEAENRRVEADKEIEQVVQAYLLRGRLLTTQFRFDEATAAYRNAIQAGPESFKANFDFAYFSQSLNRYSQAETYYLRCLELAKRNRNNDKIMVTLNNIGALYADLNRMAQARTAYEEALKIYRELTVQNLPTYLPGMAMTLLNLGNLHSDQSHNKEARKAYEEALRIYRELSIQNPDTYLPDVATTLNNLGTLDRTENHPEQARKAYEEALKIRREFAARGSIFYLSHVATTLNNLGNLHADQNQTEESLRAYNETIEIYQELAARNPEAHLPNLAMTLNNLGNLYSAHSRLNEARKAYEEALEIRQKLASGNPEAYLPKVAMMFNNLGNINIAQNRIDEAMKAYGGALKIYWELSANNPDVYMPYVAGTLNNLGNVNLTQGKMEDASKAYEEALKTYREVASKDSDTSLLCLAVTLNNLGNLHHTQNRMQKAREAYEEALQLYLLLAKKNPERFTAEVERVKASLSETEK
jgi:tetratricopeptide (TPR) repeat protein